MAMAMSLSMAPTPSTSRLSFTSPSLSQSSFHGIRFAVALPKRILIASSSNSVTVKMSKKDDELKEIRAKTTEEINEEIVDLKGELFMLRLQRSARNEFKQSDFRTFRKREIIARLLTVKRERELEEGISKRLSRKLDRQWRKSIVPRPPPSLVKLKEEAAAAEAKESA